MEAVETNLEPALRQTEVDALNLLDYLHLRALFGADERQGRAHFAAFFGWSRERYSAAMGHALAHDWIAPPTTNREPLKPVLPPSPKVQMMVLQVNQWMDTVRVSKPRRQRKDRA